MLHYRQDRQIVYYAAGEDVQPLSASPKMFGTRHGIAGTYVSRDHCSLRLEGCAVSITVCLIVCVEWARSISCFSLFSFLFFIFLLGLQYKWDVYSTK